MDKEAPEQDSNSLNVKDIATSPTPPENQLNVDQRDIRDRRKRPTPFLGRYTFFGRRKKHRRDGDPQQNYYVDRVGTGYLVVIIVIFALSVSDSLFTLYHLKRGYREINPILNAFLFNNAYFLIVKYALTLVGISALALHKFFVFVRELVIILIVGYTLLNVYQVWLYLR